MNNDAGPAEEPPLQNLEEIQAALHLSGLTELYNAHAVRDIPQSHDGKFKLEFEPTSELCTAWERKAEYEEQGLAGWPEEQRAGFHINIVDNAGNKAAAVTYLEKKPGAFYVAGTTHSSGCLSLLTDKFSERGAAVQAVTRTLIDSLPADFRPELNLNN